MNAKDGSVRSTDPDRLIGVEDDDEDEREELHPLDDEASERLHSRLLGLFLGEVERQRDFRVEMALDHDFYDNLQWSEEDKRTLEARGQMAIVYNVISTSIDWILGTQRRGRTEPKVLPRRKDDGRAAERKTALLKYLNDVNRTSFAITRAFKDAVVGGMGWMDDGWQSEVDGEPIYGKRESWRNVLHDSLAEELDLSDARYVFRAKWLDVDTAVARYPERAAIIRRAASDRDTSYNFDLYGDAAMDSHEDDLAGGVLNNGVHDDHRDRVRIIECWYRVPEEAERMSGDLFGGEMFDPSSRGHVDALNEGDADITRGVTMRMRLAVMTTAGLLHDEPSPYRHNRFPLTPIWGHRRDRDGAPYGAIRRMRDPQEDLNKRMSKALHILSSNKVIAEEGAIPESQDAASWVAELSKPDAVIWKTAGKELVLDADRGMDQAHLDFVNRDISLIQAAGGVTDENLGRRTNASSGKAIIARQDQGALTTAVFFDHLLLAQQVRGQKMLSLIEQFMDERRAFRITNDRGTPEYIEVNDGAPENDIARSAADFVLAETAWHATMRQAQATELMEVMATFPPQVALAMIDLVVEMMDVPNGEELVKRIRAATGMKDPDADPNAPPDPEEQAKAQAQAMQMQHAMKMAEAELRKAVAEADADEASAAQRRADAAKKLADMTNAQIGTIRTAVETAEMAIASPVAAEVADGLVTEAQGEARAAVAPPPIEGPAPQPGPAPIPGQPDVAAPQPSPMGGADPTLAEAAPQGAPIPVPAGPRK